MTCTYLYVFYLAVGIISTLEDLKTFKLKVFFLANKTIFCLASPIATFLFTSTGWKSQRSKIHRLAYRFSIDFSLLGLAYGFLSKSPRFLFGNHKHLTEQKS